MGENYQAGLDRGGRPTARTAMPILPLFNNASSKCPKMGHFAETGNLPHFSG